ncbi:phytase [Mycena amicta]|nr:phytase [Mycena amicta]
MVLALNAAWAALSAFLPSLGPQLPLFQAAHDQPEFAIEHSWGVYSPFHAVEQYPSLPNGCGISQLHRHGARLPSESQTEDILSGVNKLLSVAEYTDERLDFLHTFEYTLGENLLVPLGALQSQQSGETAFNRYASLISEDDLPFVRASGMSRVVDTALNWTAGFAAASNNKYAPRLSVVISEEGNDTLQDNNCPNAASSHKEMGQWLDVYAPPLAARLDGWAPGANLTNNDIHGLMMLCAFHTVCLSRFCGLFEPTDDVDRYYTTGFLRDSLDRPCPDHTCTNTTLDADPTTFPLDRTVYADFTHDAPLVAIFNTLGLFPTASLSTRPKGGVLDPTRAWDTSNIMTFSSRLVVEKIECQPRSRVVADHEMMKKKRTKSYVRIMVNEVLQPLAFCGAPPSGDFRGQSYARHDGEGDWEKCFV